MWRYVCGFAALALLVFAGRAGADEAGANKYLDQAKQQAADKDPADKVETSLKLAEAELDGVDPAKKTPIVQGIAAVRAQLKTAEMAAFKANIQRELNRAFETAEAQLGVRQTGINKQLDDIGVLLADPKTTEALGAAEVDSLKKKLATFRKVNADKMAENDLAAATRDVEYVEKQFPEWMKDLKEGSPVSQTGAASSMERRYAEFQTAIKDLPKDQPAVKALVARMDKMNNEVYEAYGKIAVAEVLDALKRNWEIDAPEFQGWEAETAPATFAQMTKEQSQTMSKLGAPKTAAAAARARQFMKSLDNNSKAKQYAQTPPLKDFIESIVRLKNDTESKLYTFAEGIVGEAEKATLTQDSRNRLEYLVNDDLRLVLEGHPQLAPLQARGQKAIAAFDAAQAAGAKSMSDAYTKRMELAASMWPDLVKNAGAVEGFDPAKAKSFQGTLVRIKGRNRMGWDFGVEGGFDFALDIDGKPVAGRYSAEVRKAIDDLEAATGQGLPEETAYDILAVYEGTDGKLMRRVQFDGNVKVENTDVRVRGEEKKEVDAPVLNIVGLYCGPVAVYSPSASAATSHGSAGGSGFFAHLLALLIMALAGFTVLLKAEFAPLASLPQLGSVKANLTSRNAVGIGMAFFVLALYSLLRGYIYYGLVGNLALAAAGAYLALDLLEAQSWWKPDFSAKLRQFAVPVGIACIAIGLWRLIVGFPAFV